jgi:tyrosine aminotransferase
MNPAPTVLAAVAAQIASHEQAGGSRHGYPPSTGYAFARAAVARRFATAAAPLGADDVVLASGCSGALELVMSALGNPGDNFLVPTPGFSLYLTICGNKGFESRGYNLVPEREWEVDLAHLESLIDARTRAIIVNNPSNPCGSVYSRAHLEALVAIAERRRVPLIADEVYAHMVFAGQVFVPLADVCGDVPCFSVGGVAKQYLAPGWRLGWSLLHDPAKHAAAARAALNQLSQARVFRRWQGANHQSPENSRVFAIQLSISNKEPFVRRVSKAKKMWNILSQFPIFRSCFSVPLHPLARRSSSDQTR